MREETRFVAFDGTPWDSKEACLAHEAKHPELRLVGLDSADVAMAISRSNVDLADAIELVAARIARKRREAGTLRRQPAVKLPTAAEQGGSGQAPSNGAVQGGVGTATAGTKVN